MAQRGPLVSACGIRDEGAKTLLQGETAPESLGKELCGATFLVRPPSRRFPVGNWDCGEVQERCVWGGRPAVAGHRVDPVTGPAFPGFGALGLIYCGGPGDPPPLTSDSVWEMRQVYCTGDLTFSENPINSFSTNIFRGSPMLKPAEDPGPLRGEAKRGEGALEASGGGLSC